MNLALKIFAVTLAIACAAMLGIGIRVGAMQVVLPAANGLASALLAFYAAGIAR